MAKKESMNQEASVPVVQTQSNLPAEASVEAWGTEYVGTQDILIPKILPMQGLSQLVSDGKALMGEFRDSISGAKIGSLAEPFLAIPFHVQKFWDILEEGEDGNFKWRKSEPLIENPVEPGYNDNLPWTDVVNGAKIKRIRRMNFFVLLPQEVEKGNSMPYTLSFKSTSFREGKKLFTQMFLRNKRAGLAPCAFAFVISGEKVKNDKGTFIVPKAELGRQSTAKEITEAFNWYQLIRKGGVKVDDSDLNDTSTVAAEAADLGTGDF